MKLNKLASILLIGVVTLSSIMAISCKKIEYVDEKFGGCYDINSPLYDVEIDYDDGSCQFAYVNAYEITQHPEKDPSGSNWDVIAIGEATKADLKLTVGIQQTGETIFESSEKDDQTYNEAATWVSPYDLQLLNQTYNWTLNDNDVSGEELIAKGTFNPIQLASGGEVVINHSNGTVLKLHYTLK